MIWAVAIVADLRSNSNNYDSSPFLPVKFEKFLCMEILVALLGKEKGKVMQ